MRRSKKGTGQVIWGGSRPAGSSVVAAFKYTWTTEVLWGKRDGPPLSKEERASERLGHSLKRGVPDPCPDRFYCFSRPLTSKKVRLYYAKVCFGWLSFADKGEGVAEYIKGGYLQCKGRSGLNG